MEFNKAYNRQEFMSFLQNNFLPEDFKPTTEEITVPDTMRYTKEAVKLGTSPTLDLVVYEIKHTSTHDARVSLSKEAFRLLAEEMEDRALVIFVPEDDNSTYRFSLIEITLDMAEDGTRISRSYSNPHRYSYLLGEGIAYHTPNKYLNDKGRVVNDEDLHSRFSVEVLTKEFYNELSDWYAWAVRIIRFPNDITTVLDNAKFNQEGGIRLITRLIFVWFLKQRHLVPDEFFDEKYIAGHLIEGFNPHQEDTLFGKSYASNYYRAILQNLFFAMLNCPITKEGSNEITERKFKDGRSGYDDNKLMRYKDLFKDPDLFVQLANETVPFLNGGLFDCLDDKDNGMYYDGFSERTESIHQLCVPDFLFFGEEAGKNIDLSEFYGDKKKKKVSARGIIDILKRYNFTVEENTPFDQEVSLDPELLGKVFENLLAAYNPETQTTARKQTGSFYTPREIVQYMVEESLVAHLKRTVGEEYESEYRQLMEYSDDEIKLSDEIKHQIITSLYNCKILDPACGSGAFPMGMLQQMVHILSRLDPNNEQWRKIMLDDAIAATSDAYRNSTDDERKEIIADIERSFDEAINRPDYARKLYLIENCIYGVDIQPIAIQISKLRFFISLVVDQITNTDATDNFGIRPLPNLEAKFVAANTLIGLDKKNTSLFDSDLIRQIEKEMAIAKHKIFGAKTVKTKRKYKELVKTIRLEIATLLEENGIVGNEEALRLKEWDMFDQNTFSFFFDSEWMFDIKDGFDIVIGNPPYGVINKKQNKGESITVDPEILEHYKNDSIYKPAQGGMLNIFRLFIVKSINLLTKDGVFSEIFPLAFTCDISSSKLREYTIKKSSIISIDAFPERDDPKKRVFENAKMSVCIMLLKKKIQDDTTFNLRINRNRYISLEKEPSQISYLEIKQIDDKYKTIPLTEKKDTDLIMKIYQESLKFSSYGKCNTGEIDMTFCKGAFIHNKNSYRMLRGANIDRYTLKTDISQGENLYIDNVLLHSIKNINDNLFHSERIVMQGITGVNERIRLKMNLIKDAYCANSTNYLTFKNEVNPKFFLALFNSKLMNYVFKQFSTNSNVNGYEVENLPIIINLSDQIIHIVDSIIKAKANDVSTNTSDLENQIDLLVYKLYGLTYDEIKIVDPETQISEFEYNK